jgi:uncharacterized protein YwqG
MEISSEQLQELAHSHFPAAFANAWSALIKPAISLRPATGSDQVIGTLGGVPTLGSAAWPQWQGHGPLSHVLSIDCSMANTLLPELGLPPAGHLAFFYFDGRFNSDYGTVGFWDPDSQAGQRVLHVTDGQGETATVPDGLAIFTSVSLTGAVTATPPSYNHPRLGDGWQSVPQGNLESFDEAIGELMRSLGPRHQLGGHAHPIQDAVEYEIAEAMGRSIDPDSFTRESDSYQILSKDLQLLAQVDSDHGAQMSWGDMGILYWERPSSEVAAGSVTTTGFTWQCG